MLPTDIQSYHVFDISVFNLFKYNFKIVYCRMDCTLFDLFAHSKQLSPQPS